MNSQRHIVVVDTETNGLDPARHQAVEVAWWNLTTDKRGRFITAHNVSHVLAEADVKALQINRYIDRIADHAPRIDNRWNLFDQLRGVTLAGSNPAFDAAILEKLFRTGRTTNPEGWRAWQAPWHHRLLDLSAYAAGMLHLPELPGLAKVCELLDIEPGDHSAEADVTATGECFKRLFEKATVVELGAS